jgi:hypothetical protein
MASQELRRRIQLPLEQAVEASEASPVLKKLAKADLFVKFKEEYQRHQSPVGAALSMGALVLIVTLLLYEIVHYAVAWDAYKTEISVDTSAGNVAVPIHFDITFPSIPCHALTVDAIDATGAEENNVAHDLFKSPVNSKGQLMYLGKHNYVERRLGPDGSPVGPKNYDERKDPRSPKFCGNCYIEPSTLNHGYDRRGGPVDDHVRKVHGEACCNTCEQVMSFYDQHRIPRPHAFDIEQCIEEMSRANPGCNLRGTLQFRRVRGNFHFSPPHGMQMGPFGQHIQTFDLASALHFNISHRINHFFIGDPSVQRFSKRGVVFPLDGKGQMFTQGLGFMKYFLQIVPTSYQNGRLKFDADGVAPLPPSAFEFSVQEHHTEFTQLNPFGQLPGLYFVFDFHPMHINNIFERPSVSRFFVRACSIIGGVFVVLGFVDRAVEYVMRHNMGLEQQ